MSYTPGELWEEVKAGYEQSKQETLVYKKLVAQYHGPAYRSSRDFSYSPNGTIFSFISFFLTQVAYYDPRPTVEARRSGKSRDASEAYRMALERWQSDTRLRETLVRLYVDMFMCGGVGLMTLEEDRSYRKRKIPPEVKRSGPVVRPVLKRIPRPRFFRDAGCYSPDEAILKGHIECLPKKKVIRRAENDPEGGWDIEAVRNLTESRDNELMGWDNKVVPRRNEITYYNVWVRDAEEDEDDDPRYNGMLYCLGVGTSASKDQPVELRKPRRAYCPRWGPYLDYFGIHIVPDEAQTLSPIVATSAQSDEVNAVSRAVSMAVQGYKKGTLVDSTIADRIKAAANDFIIPVEGFDKSRMADYEIGGITEQLVKSEQLLLERLQRALGLADAKLGMVSGQGTATENAIADDSTDARLGWIREQARSATELVLASAGFYFFHDERILYPLGTTSDGGEAWFTGGDAKTEEDMAFEDFEWKIEAHSMSQTRESHERRSAAELIQLLGVLVPMIQQNPFADWDEIVARLGDAYDIPAFDRVLGVKQLVAMARMMAAQAMGAAGQGGAGTPGASAPKLTPNVGGDSPGRVRLEGKVRGAAIARGLKAGGAPNARV